ncbi:beta family protein [Endozoicomonas montiporae]|uniref:Uncharacterized protein n=1 Tax=Endozoicomonas montiporae CL-33 TaxID=570277 RepID=A0A142BJ63_9GAMM|nr:hypothetical protein EZMO1_4901 [Endozoicomonas montiporae CL-33]
MFLDANFIRDISQDQVSDAIEESYRKIVSIKGVQKVVMLATSFPKSPAALGKDHEGEFDILEEKLYQNLSRKVDIGYGDYASINTQQIEIKGGTFVPRIDICLEDKFIYKRYRRHDGSYQRCAQNMVLDGRYSPLGTWADEEIKLATDGKHSGRSPSFWIAVRINYYVTKKVEMRSLA